MENILVVEDDRFVRENIFELLGSEGYNCTLASNGLEALKEVSAQFPDLIISDIMMPHMDGYELLDKIRNNENTELIPIIFLSAKTDRQSVRYGMGIGADDYISKPFSADELLATVKARIKKSKTYELKFNEIKSSITRYVPHELRTQLVSILGYSDMMLDDIKTLSIPEFEEMLRVIKRSGKRMYDWVEK